MAKNLSLEQMLDREFGKNPLEGLSFYNGSKRMHLIKKYHESKHAHIDEKTANKTWEVDDITWEDLEMDQVFLRINHTNSFIGEQMLYDRLHSIPKEANNDFTSRLEKLSAKRKSLEKQLRKIGKHDQGYYLYEFLINSDLWKIGNLWLFHGLQVLLLVTLVCLIIFQTPLTAICFALSVAINVGVFITTKQKYEIYISALANFKSIYDFCKTFPKNGPAELLPQKVKDAVKNLNGMSKIMFGLSRKSQGAMTGDLAGILADYLSGMLLVDVSMFNHMMRVVKNKEEDVMTLLEFAGTIDSDISILSYRESLAENWCQASIAKTECPQIAAEALVHPLLNAPVDNDISLNGKAMITGVNASGKSTFMKALAINCILAQSIYTCTAKQFGLSPMQVLSCMSLRDDVLSGESYYFREAKYLKRMLDVIATENQVLIVIDEILKGTNTTERVAASSAILDYVAKTKCLAIVATHDVELTQKAGFDDYYFSSQILENDISFDYKIHHGVTNQANAIALLSFLGYPKSIVEQARENVAKR